MSNKMYKLKWLMGFETLLTKEFHKKYSKTANKTTT